MRKPNPTDDFLKFYALLDSESLTGGYEFVVQYGAITTMDIKATIFVRKKRRYSFLHRSRACSISAATR